MNGKAIFLDRDGTIIHDVGYPKDPRLVELLPDVIKSLKKLIDKDFKLIIISNQSGIGRGIITTLQMKQVNRRLTSILKKNNIKISGIYYCPHAPEENCNCRKPSPALILKAAKEFDINLTLSFMIGDKMSDIEAGKKAGCRTILLNQEGFQFRNNILDYTAKDWNDIVPFILNETLLV